MTLATRCSACGTSFRVVQDQLKVSGGWVRCGRCNEVFNALESLYEIETQGASGKSPVGAPTPQAAVPGKSAVAPKAPSAPSPTPSSEGVAAPATDSAEPSESSSTRGAASDSASSTSDLRASAPAAAGLDTSASAPTAVASSLDAAAVVRGQTLRTAPVQAAASPPGSGWVPFQGDKRRSFEADPDHPPPMAPPPGELEAPADDAGGYGFKSVMPTPQSEPAEWDDRPVHGFEDVETRLEPRPGEETGPTPSFMRQQRISTGSAAPSRTLQWAAFGLAALLFLQLTLAWRDSLAARLPALEPVLAKVCLAFACQVSAPRDMSALILDGSNLKQRSTAQGYELVVALRNRSAAGVMWPSFELTLTDNQGQALIRRVLTPQEFGVRDSRIGPGADVSLQTVLDVSDRRIAGYTVEIFYP